jgi:stage V sporulation protein B
MQTKNETSFLKKSILLILSNLTTGILGFTYSVILSRAVGAEGMGLYGLIFPINSLLLSVITGGMMIAISNVISEYRSKNEIQNIRKTIRVTLLFNLILSSFLIFSAFLLSRVISVHIIKDIRTLYGLRLVLISTLFMALSNTYKGYFFGTMKVTIPAFIDVFEKLIRIILLLILFKVYTFPTMTSLVTVSFLIFALGELASLIFFYLYYYVDLKEFRKLRQPSSKSWTLLSKLLHISIPLMIAELISSSIYTVSTLMVPRRLIAAGIPYISALEIIGRFTSMSMQIVFFPMIIIGSVISLLVPDISNHMTTNDVHSVVSRVKSVFNFSIQVGLIVTLIGLLFGEQLGQVIFKQDNLGPYIRFLAFGAPIVYLSAITRGTLNGLGKQNILLRNTILLSILQIIMLYVLIAIPSINIYGLGITIIFTSLLTIFINVRVIKKTIPIKFLVTNHPKDQKQLRLRYNE